MNSISESSIAICGLVKDCSANLAKNISTIEEISRYFNKSVIVIFENDSTDNTKQVLYDWKKYNNQVNLLIEDGIFNNIADDKIPESVNPFFSRKRISRMVMLRNKYLDFLDNQNIEVDYLMVVDLDVDEICVKGVLTGFHTTQKWDALFANGFSISPQFKYRYHDTYALTELGNEENPMTEKSIYANELRFAFLRAGQPLFPVYSAFGGLAIYRYEAIRGFRYDLLKNEDSRVEVKCEHIALHQQMHERGYGRLYINPDMLVNYQKITCKYLLERAMLRVKGVVKQVVNR